MVSYHKWTSIAFEVAKEQGMATTQSNNRELISVAADIWNDRKQQLSSATVGEARNVAEREISA